MSGNFSFRDVGLPLEVHVDNQHLEDPFNLQLLKLFLSVIIWNTYINI